MSSEATGVRFERACGVLLHPTSLPGPYGIGDLGPAAERYAAWLAQAGVGWWQVLPLNPPGPGLSPYAATSTFAGNTALVSPEALVADGVLDGADIAAAPAFLPDVVDIGAVAYKRRLFDQAFRRFEAQGPASLALEFDEFRAANRFWLDDYALFAVLRGKHGEQPWWRWPKPLAGRDAAELDRWRHESRRELLREAFAQFLFDRQWRALRRRAAALGVRILGDLPIYVADDSADVWANRSLFQLDDEGRPTAVAGVPPDYFSADGQLWGNPLYDWEWSAATGHRWWIERMRRTLELFDAVRLDHFRGFAAYFSVPAGERTARRGRWVPGPGRALFDALGAALGELPLVAEDLGVITPDVEALRDELGLPGMAVLQFAFAPSPRSNFLPYRHRNNLVVYTGTHDNNTTRGWYDRDASDAERDFVRRYLATDAREIHWDLIRAALASVAALAVVPHQDIAGLGSEARMNTPSKVDGNWRFRLPEWALSDWHRVRLAELVETYGRKVADDEAGSDG